MSTGRAGASGARGLALELLCTIEAQAAYANLALDRRLAAGSLGAVDRGLVTELVYGVIRRRLTLDWILGQFVRRPLASLPVWLRNLLRLSLYQLLYLTRIPAAAVCDEAVTLAKRRGHSGIGGLVNGVLRTYLRDRESVVWPDPEREPVRHLSVLESHPEWIVDRWVARLGYAEAAALLALDNLPPPVVLRVNLLRARREDVCTRLRSRGIDCETSQLVPEGVMLKSRSGSLETLPELAEGLAQVQDEASMLIAHLVAPRPGERILDAAAAPGGKATHLAELMQDCGEVVAQDVHPEKLSLIRENARRLGLNSVRAVEGNALNSGEEGEVPPSFDRVLLDAPCTGLGVLRRRPDARWRKDPGDVRALSDQQKAMLRSVAALVRGGGRLVYSTCSTEPEEGEEVVDAFLSDCGSEFVLRDAAGELAARGVPAGELKSAFAGPFLRLWPQRQGTDGFFAACLERIATRA